MNIPSIAVAYDSLIEISTMKRFLEARGSNIVGLESHR